MTPFLMLQADNRVSSDNGLRSRKAICKLVYLSTKFCWCGGGEWKVWSPRPPPKSADKYMKSPHKANRTVSTGSRKQLFVRWKQLEPDFVFTSTQCLPAIIAEINFRIDIYLIFDDTRDGLWRFRYFRHCFTRLARSKFGQAKINIPFHVIGQFEYQKVE